ncbi:MAG TPA: ABC transporter ATP-binding protein [Polyangiaceae bacterium]|nr:ABC transporter ATP-binding protein [Polyangiaceae bacterium]
MAFLELRGVCKSYGQGPEESHVLKGIDLGVEKGEFVAIVGYSGAGKTTLISIIAGLLAPDRGDVTLDGRAIREPGPDRGVVFQNYSLLPWLDVFHNIYLAVDQVFADWSVEKKKEHTRKYVAMVNLTPASQKRPAELSGGMRQRVAVARALAMEPEVLLLDEPLGALDALTRATLQAELARIHQVSKKTVILITNDVDEGLLLADRIVPLGAAPAASLGPSFSVDIERPRDRKAMNHDPRFKALRTGVIEWLVESAAERRRRRPVEGATKAAEMSSNPEMAYEQEVP